jgi:hypothetical protein
MSARWWEPERTVDVSTDKFSIRHCTWLLNQRGFRYWREANPALMVYPHFTGSVSTMIGVGVSVGAALYLMLVLGW